ncbi:MAG: tetraacyldisaccharide 4'-kinase, partial [Deltaproteobacteria bacterium]
MSARITQFFWIISFPVSCLWALATHLRRKFYPYFLNKKINIKVVCVGNIHSGGSGKTPLVKAITDHLKDLSPVIVSRGYKGKLSSTGSRVERENKQGVECYGDESWMLANQTDAPVFIAQDRLSMIKKVELSYPNCLVVLDDGFQRLSVSKDISLICINTDKKIEDNFCLPLGELREPLSALRHADAVVLTPGSNGGGADVWRTFLEKAFPNLKIFQAEHKVQGLFYEQMEKKIDLHDRIVSFCGIASPQRFTSAVQQLFPGSQ